MQSRKTSPQPVPKPVRWVASSKDDLSDSCGWRALGCADRPQVAGGKALKGFGDAGVLEVVADFDGSTFRTVYTVRFSKAVYALHAFQKKSRRATATPKSELDLIAARLARAREDYEAWLKSL